jgi:hypothetical protein
MQKIERSALAQAQVAGGCGKGNSQASNKTVIVIKYA